MAVTTTNEKLALMAWMQPWQLPLPISADGLGQADIQSLLWGYPGVLWAAPMAPFHDTWRQQFTILRRITQPFEF